MNAHEFIKNHPHSQQCHLRRFNQSWRWVKPLLGSKSTVLECGDTGCFTDLLKAHGHGVENTAPYELRNVLPFKDGRFDGVLCMEVLEHIKDREGELVRRADGEMVSNRATFDASGIRHLLGELFRVTRPGGFLFLTTPNVCSHLAVAKILRGRHPFMYPPHVRELAPGDVKKYVAAAGWQLQSMEVMQVWNHVVDGTKKAIDRLAKQIGGKPPSGDCIFLVGVK